MALTLAELDLPDPESRSVKFDAFQLVYNEPNACANFDRLRMVAPYARQIEGDRGIHASHRKCARNACTSHFFVVDGDNWVYDNFPVEPDFEPDPNAVYVWRCRNPVNGLVYGYGAVKLFPTDLVLKQKSDTVDMTTSLTTDYRIIDTLISETRFNTSPFEAWKSGFRECAKLASGSIRAQDPRTGQRLDTWCRVGMSEPNGSWVLDGARSGREYGETHVGNTEAMTKINDWSWLRMQFDQFCRQYGIKA